MSLLEHVRLFFVAAAVSRIATTIYDRVTEGEKAGPADAIVIVASITWAVLLTIAIEIRRPRLAALPSPPPSPHEGAHQ